MTSSFICDQSLSNLQLLVSQLTYPIWIASRIVYTSIVVVYQTQNNNTHRVVFKRYGPMNTKYPHPSYNTTITSHWKERKKAKDQIDQIQQQGETTRGGSLAAKRFNLDSEPISLANTFLHFSKQIVCYVAHLESNRKHHIGFNSCGDSTT